MALFVFRKLILQMGSHPVELDVRFLVGPFVYFHTSCMCANSEGSGETEISTIISWAGSWKTYGFMVSWQKVSFSYHQIPTVSVWLWEQILSQYLVAQTAGCPKTWDHFGEAKCLCSSCKVWSFIPDSVDWPNLMGLILVWILLSGTTANRHTIFLSTYVINT